MKRLFILLSMIPLYSVLLGQGKSDDFHRIQLGVNFAPAYAYRTLNWDSENWILQGRNEYEIAKFGYSGGLNIYYNLNDWFGIGSGIQYANKGYRAKKVYMDEDQTDFVLNNSQWFRTVHRFHYVEIPLKAQFTMGKQKVRFLSGVGLTTGFLLNQTNAFQYDGGENKSENYADQYNRINLFPTVSVGVDYKITSKSNVRIEPMFQYGIVETAKSSDEYLWSLGVNVSYLIGIK